MLFGEFAYMVAMFEDLARPKLLEDVVKNEPDWNLPERDQLTPSYSNRLEPINNVFPVAAIRPLSILCAPEK